MHGGPGSRMKSPDKEEAKVKGSGSEPESGTRTQLPKEEKKKKRKKEKKKKRKKKRKKKKRRRQEEKKKR